MSRDPRLRLRPWTVKRADALEFVREVHRRQPKVQGAMWCVSVRRGSEIVGVALVGMPPRTQTTVELDTLSVLRVAVKDDRDPDNEKIKLNLHACSMLYGACWKAARAMGATSMSTFTHLDEDGKSLIAAGWTDGGLTEGGEWDRPSRRRTKAVDPRPKVRWWAPGSLRGTRP